MADIKIKICELSNREFTQDLINTALVRFSYLYEDHKIIKDKNLFILFIERKYIRRHSLYEKKYLIHYELLSF